MALTVTRSGDWQHIAGNRRVANITVGFDSSYPTGGESFTAADVGMRVIEKVQIQPDNGYHFEFDYTNNLILVYMGASYGVVTTNTTSNPNTVTGSESTLTTYTLPANAVGVNGAGVRVTAWGQSGNPGANTTIRAYFGSIALSTTILSTAVTWQWKSVYELLRVSSTSMDSNGQLLAGSSAGTVSADIEFLSATTVDFTTTNAIRLVANAPTNTYSVTQEGMIVEVLPGASGTEVTTGTDLSLLTNVRVTVWGY